MAAPNPRLDRHHLVIPGGVGHLSNTYKYVSFFASYYLTTLLEVNISDVCDHVASAPPPHECK